MFTSLVYLGTVRELFFIVLISSALSTVSVLFYLVVSGPEIALKEMAISAVYYFLYFYFDIYKFPKGTDRKAITNKNTKKKINRLVNDYTFCSSF
jgi:uncharacterized MnhB-related membrane protein